MSRQIWYECIGNLPKTITSLGIRLPNGGLVLSLDFTGWKLIYDRPKDLGRDIPLITEKAWKGHFGASPSKGLYGYGGRSEEETLPKQETLSLKMLDFLESRGALVPAQK